MARLRQVLLKVLTFYAAGKFGVAFFRNKKRRKNYRIPKYATSGHVHIPAASWPAYYFYFFLIRVRFLKMKLNCELNRSAEGFD